jgi:archaemetzincin
MKISLRPLGDINSDIMEELKGKIRGVFGCPVEIKLGFSDLEYAYAATRRQYLAPTLLSHINALERDEDERTVGITEVDLYAPGLNFVFGEADIISRTAIISLCRLRQEYYGLPPDKNLFLERATKEIVHELGHTFGLGHCPNMSCIMHFSNSLADTDYKEASFCNKCRPKII